MSWRSKHRQEIFVLNWTLQRFFREMELTARSFGIFRNIFRPFCSWEQNSRNGNPGISIWAPKIFHLVFFPKKKGLPILDDEKRYGSGVTPTPTQSPIGLVSFVMQEWNL